MLKNAEKDAEGCCGVLLCPGFELGGNPACVVTPKDTEADTLPRKALRVPVLKLNSGARRPRE